MQTKVREFDNVRATSKLGAGAGAITLNSH
jgi:hypothetical protein